MSKKPGRLVQTNKGSLGIVYNKDMNDTSLYNGKIPVHIIDENFNPTGEKILCKQENLTLKGYTD